MISHFKGLSISLFVQTLAILSQNVAVPSRSFKFGEQDLCNVLEIIQTPLTQILYGATTLKILAGRLNNAKHQFDQSGDLNPGPLISQ